MLKYEKLPSTNSTKSGSHKILQKFRENEQSPEEVMTECLHSLLLTTGVYDNIIRFGSKKMETGLSFFCA